MKFVKPLNAVVELFHLTYPGEKKPDADSLEIILTKQFGNKVRLHLESTDLNHSIAQSLQKAIDASDPELVIMFTEQRRSLFQKIFLSSTTEEIAFQIKVPMLVYNKNVN